MSYKIFIVEDDEMYRTVVRDTLAKNSNLEISGFASAEECLRNLVHKPDIIILDYYLEGMTGLEALKRIKKFNPLIPVVMLSAQEKMEVAVDIIKNGAFDYVIKDESAMVRLVHIIHNVMDEIDLRKKHKKNSFVAIILSIAVFLCLTLLILNNADYRQRISTTTARLSSHQNRLAYLEQLAASLVSSNVSLNALYMAGDTSQKTQFVQLSNQVDEALNGLKQIIYEDQEEQNTYDRIWEKYRDFYALAGRVLAHPHPDASAQLMDKINATTQDLTAMVQTYYKLVNTQMEQAKEQGKNMSQQAVMMIIIIGVTSVIACIAVIYFMSRWYPKRTSY